MGLKIIEGVAYFILGGAVVGFIQSVAQGRHERLARLKRSVGESLPDWPAWFRYPGDDRRP